MIKKPRKGDTCWIIADIWETTCTIPATIMDTGYESCASMFTGSNAGEYTVCWKLSKGVCNEVRGGYTRRELYKKSAAAWQAIKAKGGVMPLRIPSRQA